ncbi:MAG: excinuclease ABC subunit UvrA [Anaerolineae bacterium]|nr:excinuclease ABC subunit UvrA [Anaerolineae bacterium]
MAKSQDKLIVRGAREHNLKNINVEIPRDQLVVITGLSGSGKSSLAFDTIYAEGQRRYVESLSAYARQFLGLMEKPDVDLIEGLSPAISIDQKGASHNPRSTVGTVTEVYDHLRLLFARAGTPHCPVCGRVIQRQSIEQMVDTIKQFPDGTRIMILAPLIKDRKGEHKKVFEDIRKAGFVRVRVNGEIFDVNEELKLDRYKQTSIEAVVDRLVVKAEGNDDTRLADSIETALKLGQGVVLVNKQLPAGFAKTNGAQANGNDNAAEGREQDDVIFSENFACPLGHVSLGEIEPRTFSFNTPHGACPACMGLGTQLEIDPDLIMPNQELSLSEGAIRTNGMDSAADSYFGKLLEAVARKYHFDMDVPVRQLKRADKDKILYGTNGERIRVQYENQFGNKREYETSFEGVIPNLMRRYKETDSDYIRQNIEQYMSSRPCPVCKGQRLKPEALAVTIDNKNIVDITSMSIGQASEFFEALPGKLNAKELTISNQILKEIRARLGFLVNVGLDYLTIDRPANTLSGGEGQRIRLATQIGSQLMGVLYILDEPSIGLHQRDNARLLETLMRLRDLGNTVLVVEHDEDTINHADYIVDMGPGAGEHGGQVIAAGTRDQVARNPKSVTGQFLSGKRKITIPKTRRQGNGKFLTIKGARENNLKSIDVKIPLGKFVCVTGVSGSGKSSLTVDILYKKLAQVLNGAHESAGKHDSITGTDALDKVIDIDQSPIGRTPRSNPATYTAAFGDIREVFAMTNEAKARGYKAGRFSFNVKGGRCEACEGDGIIKIEMQFLPDVYVPCEVCHGKRYNREALEIQYRGKNIAQVLDMTVNEAVEFFQNIPAIARKTETLRDVGLGYIRLGQPATTLSGGEAQRIKLAKELSKRATGRTLYILDEPTVGLHAADVEKLLGVLQRLVDTGNTVVVIEHNLDVIKTADWIIDLGPEGGNAGGRVIAQGTPEDVALIQDSYTGQWLKRVLNVK